MMRIFLIATIALAMAGQASAQETGGQAHKYQLSLTGNYGKWDSSDTPNKGYQNQLFAQIAYNGDYYGFAVTSRWANTHYETTLGEGALDFSTMLDTNIATYYSTSIRGFTFRGGVDLDLPTGKHAYTNNQLARIITDPVSTDLMILNSYGAGLNVAPHFVLMYPVSKQASFGFGMRYIVNGEYDPTIDIANDDLNPGDRLLALVNGAYAFTEKDIATLMLVFVRGSSDAQRGQSIYRTGDMFMLEARYIKPWSDELRSVFAGTVQTQAKNQALAEGGVMNSELQNSNNNSWEAYLNTQYKMSGVYTVTGMLGYKQVFANGYAKTDTLFEGGRSKYYLEPGGMAIFSEQLYSTLKFRYTKVMDLRDNFSAKNADYDVWNIDLAMVMSF